MQNNNLVQISLYVDFLESKFKQEKAPIRKYAIWTVLNKYKKMLKGDGKSD